MYVVAHRQTSISNGANTVLLAILAFQWFTRDHGLFMGGICLGMLLIHAFKEWPQSGWSLLGIALGIAGLALLAHFLHWWR